MKLTASGQRHKDDCNCGRCFHPARNAEGAIRSIEFRRYSLLQAAATIRSQFNGDYMGVLNDATIAKYAVDAAESLLDEILERERQIREGQQ